MDDELRKILDNLAWFSNLGVKYDYLPRGVEIYNKKLSEYLDRSRGDV